MVDAKQLQMIEESLFEAGDWLRASPPGPAARELRVRYGALLRVVGGWKMVTPHPDQLSAMLECVTDLCGAILRNCDPLARDVSRLARRTGRPSRPVLRPSGRPPGRPSARPSMPPVMSWPALGTAIPPLGHVDVFLRTTRPPPPRKPSEPPGA